MAKSNKVEILPPENPEDSQPKSIISLDVQDDYDFSRNNLRNLLEKGEEILNGIIDVAKGCDEPRAYEVAGNVLKVLIEGNKELLGIQKDVKEIEKKTATAKDDKGLTIQHADQVNNLLFEGTTLEALEFLEYKKKKEEMEKLNGES